MTSMQVYLRAHPSLQSDLEEWGSALSALCERSHAALRFLLAFLWAEQRITAAASQALFGSELDCLALAEGPEYLIQSYLSNNELVQRLT